MFILYYKLIYHLHRQIRVFNKPNDTPPSINILFYSCFPYNMTEVNISNIKHSSLKQHFTHMFHLKKNE